MSTEKGMPLEGERRPFTGPLSQLRVGKGLLHSLAPRGLTNHTPSGQTSLHEARIGGIQDAGSIPGYMATAAACLRRGAADRHHIDGKKAFKEKEPSRVTRGMSWVCCGLRRDMNFALVSTCTHSFMKFFITPVSASISSRSTC